MVKRMFFLSFIVLSINVNAQLTQNVNTVFALPYYNDYLIRFATGISYNGGYLFKNKLELGLTASGMWFFSFFQKYYSYSVGGNLKYYPFNKVKGFYFSAGTSFVQQRFIIDQYSNKYNNYTISSSIGYLKPFENVKGLFLNSELFIVKNMTKNIKYDIFGLKFGLTYRFKTK